MITKRIAPLGYVAVDKREAKRAFEQDIAVTVAGNNVNSFHIFGGWSLGCTIQKSRHEGEPNNTFENHIASFMNYLDRELGSYPVFYIKRKEGL